LEEFVLEEKESAVLVAELDASKEENAAEQDLTAKEVSAPEKKKKKPLGLWAKIGISVGTALGLFVLTVLIACFVLLRGPSETMRDALVLSAKQASATKWLPGIFLGEKTVKEIEENSKKVSFDVVAI
jgi:cytoskeletal protein RodZ